MKHLIVSFAIVLVLVSGCKAYHEDMSVKDPTGVRMSQCTDGSFARNCSTTVESNVPTGMVGGYGMGMGMGGAPYVMVTPGQAAMSQVPGSAAIVADPTPQVYPPNAGTTYAAPASSGDFATKKDVQVVGKAVVKTAKDICELQKKAGKPCKDGL